MQHRQQQTFTRAASEYQQCATPQSFPMDYTDRLYDDPHDHDDLASLEPSFFNQEGLVPSDTATPMDESAGIAPATVNKPCLAEPHYAGMDTDALTGAEGCGTGDGQGGLGPSFGFVPDGGQEQGQHQHQHQHHQEQQEALFQQSDSLQSDTEDSGDNLGVTQDMLNTLSDLFNMTGIEGEGGIPMPVWNGSYDSPPSADGFGQVDEVSSYLSCLGLDPDSLSEGFPEFFSNEIGQGSFPPPSFDSIQFGDPDSYNDGQSQASGPGEVSGKGRGRGKGKGEGNGGGGRGRGRGRKPKAQKPPKVKRVPMIPERSVLPELVEANVARTIDVLTPRLGFLMRLIEDERLTLRVVQVVRLDRASESFPMHFRVEYPYIPSRPDRPYDPVEAQEYVFATLSCPAKCAAIDACILRGHVKPYITGADGPSGNLQDLAYHCADGTWRRLSLLLPEKVRKGLAHIMEHLSEVAQSHPPSEGWVAGGSADPNSPPIPEEYRHCEHLLPSAPDGCRDPLPDIPPDYVVCSNSKGSRRKTNETPEELEERQRLGCPPMKRGGFRVRYNFTKPSHLIALLPDYEEDIDAALRSPLGKLIYKAMSTVKKVGGRVPAASASTSAQSSSRGRRRASSDGEPDEAPTPDGRGSGGARGRSGGRGKATGGKGGKGKRTRQRWRLSPGPNRKIPIREGRDRRDTARTLPRRAHVRSVREAGRGAEGGALLCHVHHPLLGQEPERCHDGRMVCRGSGDHPAVRKRGGGPGDRVRLSRAPERPRVLHALHDLDRPRRPAPAPRVELPFGELPPLAHSVPGEVPGQQVRPQRKTEGSGTSCHFTLRPGYIARLLRSATDADLRHYFLQEGKSLDCDIEAKVALIEEAIDREAQHQGRSGLARRDPQFMLMRCPCPAPSREAVERREAERDRELQRHIVEEVEEVDESSLVERARERSLLETVDSSSDEESESAREEERGARKGNGRAEGERGGEDGMANRVGRIDVASSLSNCAALVGECFKDGRLVKQKTVGQELKEARREFLANRRAGGVKRKRDPAEESEEPATPSSGGEEMEEDGGSGASDSETPTDSSLPFSPPSSPATQCSGSLSPSCEPASLSTTPIEGEREDGAPEQSDHTAQGISDGVNDAGCDSGSDSREDTDRPKKRMRVEADQREPNALLPGGHPNIARNSGGGGREGHSDGDKPDQRMDGVRQGIKAERTRSGGEEGEVEEEEEEGSHSLFSDEQCLAKCRERQGRTHEGRACTAICRSESRPPKAPGMCGATYLVDRGKVLPRILRCDDGCGESFCTGCMKTVTRTEAEEHRKSIKCLRWWHARRRNSDREFLDDDIKRLDKDRRRGGKAAMAPVESPEGQALVARICECIVNAIKWGSHQKCPTCCRPKLLGQGARDPLAPLSTRVTDCVCRVSWCYLCQRVIPRDLSQRLRMEKSGFESALVGSSPGTDEADKHVRARYVASLATGSVRQKERTTSGSGEQGAEEEEEEARRRENRGGTREGEEEGEEEEVDENGDREKGRDLDAMRADRKGKEKERDEQRSVDPDSYEYPVGRHNEGWNPGDYDIIHPAKHRCCPATMGELSKMGSIPLLRGDSDLEVTRRFHELRTNSAVASVISRIPWPEYRDAAVSMLPEGWQEGSCLPRSRRTSRSGSLRPSAPGRALTDQRRTLGSLCTGRQSADRGRCG